MTSKAPPVPSASRTPKGPRRTPTLKNGKIKDRPKHLEQQGQQGNTYQNTHHQGYQQDR